MPTRRRILVSGSAGAIPVNGNDRAALGGLLSELRMAREEGFEEDEIARAKRMLLAESVYQHETAQGYCRKVGFYQTMAGSLEAEKVYEAQLKAVDAQSSARSPTITSPADNATLVGLLA